MSDMDNSTDSLALEKIMGDMDEMESQRVYGDKPSPAEGVSITIDVAPKAPAKEEKPKEEEVLPPAPVEDESKMPPFLRKRK